jgi:energy-coupling factor transporter ATP-binding protein EcfA2
VGLTPRCRAATRPRREGKGSFVLVVGPDGCGKSTLARKLIEERKSNYTKVLHVHWRPGLLPRPGGLVGVKAGDPTDPHGQEPHGQVLSYALLAYNWLDFFLGMWWRIVPVRANGGLVVMERGWLDIAVDPLRYHLAVSPKLVVSLGRLLPSPDLVIVLEADPGILRDRKAELPLGELARQMGRWRKISFSRRTERLMLDASQEPERLVDYVTHTLSVM